MQILVDLAAQFGRKVAFVGRGMIENSQIAQRLGYLRSPPACRFATPRWALRPPQDVLCLAHRLAGRAACGAVADRDRRSPARQDRPRRHGGLSARAIPGNEKAIGRVMNHVARRGADVIHEGIKHVHVSGHGSEEELKLMLSLVRPRYFVPIHGEYRQLSQHARVAERVTGRDTGARGPAGRERRRPAVRRAPARGSPARRRRPRADRRHGVGEVGDEVLRDPPAPRRRTAWSCRWSPSTSRPARSKAFPRSSPAGSSRTTARTLLAGRGAHAAEMVEQASVEERTDQGLIKEKVRVELAALPAETFGRRPLVLPVIMEI